MTYDFNKDTDKLVEIKVPIGISRDILAPKARIRSLEEYFLDENKYNEPYVDYFATTKNY